MMLQQESHHDTRVGLSLEIITLPLEYLTENFPSIKSQIIFGEVQYIKLNITTGISSLILNRIYHKIIRLII